MCRPENVMVVVFDAPNVAVPVGTVAGAQLAAVFQSLDPGLKSQLAFCASSRDCAEAYADKQHEHALAQHPR